MRWDIDTPVRVGSLACAAIVETELTVESAGSGLIGAGTKRPLLFLLVRGDEIRAIDINANSYEVDEIERLYPQAIERLSSMLRETV